MPSPFPGMDPFIEGQCCRDFHPGMIATIRELLTERVRPRYVVQIEEYVYLSSDDDSQPRVYVPDVLVAEADLHWGGEPGGNTALAVEPVIHTLAEPDQYTQTYLTIRTRESHDVVTVIELLSPKNKSDGLDQYLAKRANLLATGIHLVEIDLLRGGRRLPTVEPLQPGDCFAFVSGPGEAQRVDVYAWPLNHPLPGIPIPLLDADPAVVLNLQVAFDTVYDRAGYDYALNYKRDLAPPVSAATQAWVQSALRSSIHDDSDD